MAPDAAFDAARSRGMDFVCLTDHNTISGALELLSRRPDVADRLIIGEEVDTFFPDSSQRVHIGVLGVDEELHDGIARLRGNCFELMEELHRRQTFFVLNHPLRGFRSIRSARYHLSKVLPLVPAIEACNGADPRCYVAIVKAMVDSESAGSKVLVGGSDAHRAARVATVFTAAPGESKSKYLESLKRGNCAVGGAPAGLFRLVWDVYAIVAAYYLRLMLDLGSATRRERIRNLPGAAALVPAVLAGLPLALVIAQACRLEWVARRGQWKTLASALTEPIEVATPTRTLSGNAAYYSASGPAWLHGVGAPRGERLP